MHKILCLLIFVAFTSFKLSAQEGPFNDDFEIWFSLQLDKKINKKWNAAISYAHRLEHNAQFQKVAFIEPSLDYRIHKRIKTSISYRYALDPFDKSTEQTVISRSAFDYNLKPFKIAYRLRFDHDIGSDEILSSIRNRFSIGYSRKKVKFTPKISYEMISANKNKGWIYNRWRLRLSTGYKLSKRNKISVFYMIQRQINEVAPQQDFVLGLGYNYTLRKWKSKRKKESKQPQSE